MYGSQSAISGQSAASALAAVEIGNIPDREGVYLRNALIDRFYTDGYPSSPRYALTVSKVTEAQRNLDITKSSEATRSQLIQTVSIALTDTQAPGKPVLEQSLSTTSSYNVLESEFATRVSADNARMSGLNDLARQIELALTLYLSRTAP